MGINFNKLILTAGVICVGANMIFSIGIVNAAFINFDDAYHMEVVNDKYYHLGVTFTGMSGGDVYAYSGGDFYTGHSPLSGSDPNIAYSDSTGIRLDFSIPVHFLSLYGVDYGGPFPYDNEIATLSAFDIEGTLQDSYTVQAVRGERVAGGLIIPSDIAFLSVSAGSNTISYAEFTFTNTNGFFGVDDVSVAAVAPEPVSSLLFIAGGIVFGGRRCFRRMRKNTQ